MTPRRLAPLQVAVGVIANDRGEVLLSRRRNDVHQGGLWEFPGGKLEPGEDSRAALYRELREELGVDVTRVQPLVRVGHNYPDRAVVLHVWCVQAYAGTPWGRQRQPLCWLPIGALEAARFPAANAPIVRLLQLPRRYLITPEPGADLDAFLGALALSLDRGIRLLQLRANGLNDADYLSLAGRVVAVTQPYGACLLLNRRADLVAAAGAGGVHLNSRRLRSTAVRPLPVGRWVAASCHDGEDLARARAMGADFAVLSPVLATASHPHGLPLGWTQFERLARAAWLPVYALGGMQRTHLEEARSRGAHGIAAIRGLWQAEG